MNIQVTQEDSTYDIKVTVDSDFLADIAQELASRRIDQDLGYDDHL